jgi:flagellar basal-body rod modification protein FlgD
MSTIDSNAALLDSLGLLHQEKKAEGPSNDLGADDFLKLMLTQMQNQNPLDPMENGEFIAQLAQFSASSGIQDLNNSFTGLAESLQSYQALQASSLVGRSVLLQADQGQLSEDGTISGLVTLDSSTPQMKLGIYDINGALVRSMPMGGHASGAVSFAWDGLCDDGTMAAPGAYEVRAEALIDGKSTAVPTLIYNDVESVSLSSRGGVLLNLAGVGTAGLSEVYQIK